MSLTRPKLIDRVKRDFFFGAHEIISILVGEYFDFIVCPVSPKLFSWLSFGLKVNRVYLSVDLYVCWRYTHSFLQHLAVRPVCMLCKRPYLDIGIASRLLPKVRKEQMIHEKIQVKFTVLNFSQSISLTKANATTFTRQCAISHGKKILVTDIFRPKKTEYFPQYD